MCPKGLQKTAKHFWHKVGGPAGIWTWRLLNIREKHYRLSQLALYCSMSAESQGALLGNSTAGASPREPRRHATIGELWQRRCHAVWRYNGTRDATSHMSTEEVCSVRSVPRLYKGVSLSRELVKIVSGSAGRRFWALARPWAEQTVFSRRLLSAVRMLQGREDRSHLATI
jgi:hypothetical protein